MSNKELAEVLWSLTKAISIYEVLVAFNSIQLITLPLHRRINLIARLPTSNDGDNTTNTITIEQYFDHFTQLWLFDEHTLLDFFSISHNNLKQFHNFHDNTTLTPSQTQLSFFINIFSSFFPYIIEVILTKFPLLSFHPHFLSVLHNLLTIVSPVQRITILSDSLTQLPSSTHYITFLQDLSKSPQNSKNAPSQSQSSQIGQQYAQLSTIFERELVIALGIDVLEQNSTQQAPNTPNTHYSANTTPHHLLNYPSFQGVNFIRTAPVAVLLFLIEKIINITTITEALLGLKQDNVDTSDLHPYRDYHHDPLSPQYNQNALLNGKKTETVSNSSSNQVLNLLKIHSNFFTKQIFTILDKLCNILHCSMIDLPNSHLLLPTSPTVQTLFQLPQFGEFLSSLYPTLTQNTTSPNTTSMPISTWIQFSSTIITQSQNNGLSPILPVISPPILFHDFSTKSASQSRITTTTSIYPCHSNGNLQFSPDLIRAANQGEFKQSMFDEKVFGDDDKHNEDVHNKHKISLPQLVMTETITRILTFSPSFSLGLLLSITTHAIIGFIARSIPDNLVSMLSTHYMMKNLNAKQNNKIEDFEIDFNILNKEELRMLQWEQFFGMNLLSWFLHWASSRHHLRLIVPILITYILKDSKDRYNGIIHHNDDKSDDNNDPNGDVISTTPIMVDKTAVQYFYVDYNSSHLLSTSLSILISTSIQFSMTNIAHNYYSLTFNEYQKQNSNNPDEISFFLSKLTNTVMDFCHLIIHGHVIAPAPTNGDVFFSSNGRGLGNYIDLVTHQDETCNHQHNASCQNHCSHHHDSNNLNTNTITQTKPKKSHHNIVNLGLYTPTHPQANTLSQHGSNIGNSSDNVWPWSTIRLPLSLLPHINDFYPANFADFEADMLEWLEKQKQGGINPNNEHNHPNNDTLVNNTNETSFLLQRLTALSQKLSPVGAPSSLALGLLGWVIPSIEASDRSAKKKEAGDVEGAENKSGPKENHTLRFESWASWCGLWLNMLWLDPWVYQYYTEAILAIHAEKYPDDVVGFKNLAQTGSNFAQNQANVSRPNQTPKKTNGDDSTTSPDDIDEFDWLLDETPEETTAENLGPNTIAQNLVKTTHNNPQLITYPIYTNLIHFSTLIQPDFPSCIFSQSVLNPSTITTFSFALLTHHFSTTITPIEPTTGVFHTKCYPKSTRELGFTTNKDVILDTSYSTSVLAPSHLPPLASPLITLCNQLSQIWQNASISNIVPLPMLKSISQVLFLLLTRIDTIFTKNFKVINTDLFLRLTLFNDQPQSPLPYMIPLSSIKRSSLSNQLDPDLLPGLSDSPAKQTHWLINFPSFSLLVNGVNVHLSATLPDIRACGLVIAQFFGSAFKSDENLSDSSTKHLCLAPDIDKWSNCNNPGEMDNYLNRIYPLPAHVSGPRSQNGSTPPADVAGFPEEHHTMQLYRGLLLIPCEQRVSFMPLARPPAVNWFCPNSAEMCAVYNQFSVSGASVSTNQSVVLAQPVNFNSIELGFDDNGEQLRNFSANGGGQSSGGDQRGNGNNKTITTPFYSGPTPSQTANDRLNYGADLVNMMQDEEFEKDFIELQNSSLPLSPNELTLSKTQKRPPSHLSSIQTITDLSPSTSLPSTTLLPPPGTALITPPKTNLTIIPSSQAHLLIPSPTTGILAVPDSTQPRTIFQTFDDHSDPKTQQLILGISTALSSTAEGPSQGAQILAATGYRPRFLSHAVKILQQREDKDGSMAQKALVLQYLEELIRKNIFSYDFIVCCNDLYPALLGMTGSLLSMTRTDQKFEKNIKIKVPNTSNLQSRTLRERAIISLFSCCPEYMLPLVFKDLLGNSNMSSLQQKFDLLTWLTFSAQELALGGNPDGILIPEKYKEIISLVTTTSQNDQNAKKIFKKLPKIIDNDLHHLLSTLISHSQSTPLLAINNTSTPTQTIESLLTYIPTRHRSTQPRASNSTDLISHDNKPSSLMTFDDKKKLNSQLISQLTPYEKMALFDAKLAMKTKAVTNFTVNNSAHIGTNNGNTLVDDGADDDDYENATNLFSHIGFEYFISPLISCFSLHDLINATSSGSQSTLSGGGSLFLNQNTTNQPNHTTATKLRSLLLTPTINTVNNPTTLHNTGNMATSVPFNTLTMDPLLLSKSLQTLSILITCLGPNSPSIPSLLPVVLPMTLITIKNYDVSVRRMSLLVLMAVFEIVIKHEKVNGFNRSDFDLVGSKSGLSIQLDVDTSRDVMELLQWLNYQTLIGKDRNGQGDLFSKKNGLFNQSMDMFNIHNNGLNVNINSNAETDEYCISLMAGLLNLIRNNF